MKIAIGSDHAGRTLKLELINYLTSLGHIVYDDGTYTNDSVDYPDFAKKVCTRLVNKEVEYGVLVCYTGIGMSIAANKYKNIRAALVGSVEDAGLTRGHNNSNILCLSQKNTPVELAKEIAHTFLNTAFEGGRHERRVNKIGLIENE